MLPITRKPLLFYGVLLLLIVLVYRFTTPTNSSTEPPATHYSLDSFTHKALLGNTLLLEDITLQAGIQRGHIQRSEHLSGLHESLGAGACAFDYDSDGWVDLLLLNGSGTTHFYGQAQWWQAHNNSITLYKNNADETFSDVTASSGINSNGWTMGCAYGDIDNDADMDIFISQYGNNQLWENLGNGKFQDISKTSGIHGNHWSTSVNFVDVNRDGLIDIYVNNFIDFQVNALTFEHQSGYETTLPAAFDATLFSGQANQLWINQGNKIFLEQAKVLEVDNPQGRSLHSTWLDINDDGFSDLLIANGKDTANKVFLNEEGKTFKDISLQSRLAFTDKASHITFGDFNRDGRSDIFWGTDHTEFAKLYSASKKDPTIFNDASHQQLAAITTASQSHWASVAEDFNLDGWNDLYISNGLSTPNKNIDLLSRGQSDKLLLYQPNKGFTNNSQMLSPGTRSSLSSRCALAADINNNGRTDIFVSNNNNLGQLLKNTGQQTPWLGVELASKNIPTYGAVVTVNISSHHKTQTFTQTYGNKHSFLCMGDQRLRFALPNFTKTKGSAKGIADISINWPDGTRQTISNLQYNRYHRIHYQQTKTEQLPSSQIQGSIIDYQKPQHKLMIANWLIEQKHVEQAIKELTLLQKSTNPNIRLAALQAAALLPEKDQLAFIQSGFTDTSNKVRLEAIALTRKNENELLSRWLLKQLEHNDPVIACAASDTFAHFYDEEEAFIIHKYTALSPLIRMAESGPKETRLCAIHALGKSEHYRALQPLLALAKEHANNTENSRIAAIQSLALLKEKSALPTLLELANNIDESNTIRKNASYSVYTIDAELAKKKNLPFEAIPNRQIPTQHTPEATEKSNKGIDSNNATIFEKGAFYKSIPTFIKPLLEKNHAQRATLLIELTQRKERWARNIIKNTLNNDDEPADTKQNIIKHLPKPLSVGYQKLLTQIEQKLIAEYGRLLAQKNRDEKALIDIAKIIYAISPKKAINLAYAGIRAFNPLEAKDVLIKARGEKFSEPK